MKKVLIFLGVLLGLPFTFAAMPTDYLNRLIDDLTSMLTETVFKAALLVMVISAIYLLLPLTQDTEKRDFAKRLMWYSIIAIVIVKSAPAFINYLRGL